MSLVTPKQIAKTINLIADSEIGLSRYQALLESGRFTELLCEFGAEQPHHESTITPITVPPIDYDRRLVVMRDAGRYYRTRTNINDVNFPVEAGESGERELFLVCFHRDIYDSEDPEKSELLRELDKLGLKPEGPPELCAIGEHHPDLQRKFQIVARRQVWRCPYGYLVCPILRGNSSRILRLNSIRGFWLGNCRFLASCK